MLKRIHYLIFLTLSILLLTGVNEYLSGLVGQEEALSVLIFFMVLGLFFIRILDQGIIRFRPIDSIQGAYLKSILAFLTIGVFMAWADGNSEYAYWGFRYYGPGILVFLVFYHSIVKLNEEYGMPHIILMFRNILLINGFLAVFDFLSDGSLGLVRTDNRYSGLISNPNDAGFCFNILLILNYYLFRIKKSKFGLIGIVVSTAAIFVSFSKTAIISALLILFLILRREFGRGGLVVKFIIIIITGISVSFSGGYIISISNDLELEQSNRLIQITDVFNGQINSETTTHRTEIFDMALKKLEGGWILGQGIGSFARINLKKLDTGVHNQYLLILGESGIIALLFFIYFIVKMMLFRIKKGTPGLETMRLMTFAFAFYCFTNHNIFFSKFIILIIAIMIVLSKVVRDNYLKSIIRNSNSCADL